MGVWGIQKTMLELTNGADVKDLPKLNWCLKNVLNYFVFHHMT